MEKKLILDVNENPTKIRHWILFALQHVLAMFVACITVPMLTGIPVDATIFASGIGTLFYIFATKRKSPVFLSSSFAYIAPIISALALGNAVNKNFLAVMIGMGIVGLIYVIIALIVKKVGTEWLNKLLPPIVIGPIIMTIGLSLAGSAVNNLTGVTSSMTGGTYNLIHILCGLVAMIVTCLCARFGKSTIKMIPFVIGMSSGYIVALIFTLIGMATNVDFIKVIDFSPIINNFKDLSISSFISFPDFIFLKDLSAFDISQLPEIILLFAPVALVTICEHIGDHLNLGNIIDKNLLKDPGLTRTLIGDGVATSISGILSGAANTTYGENVAVIGISKVASVNVIIVAACVTMGLGFITPIMCLVETIPSCVTGGVSLILYGFIAGSGVKILVRNRINLESTKNILVLSVMLISGIGGLTIMIPVANVTLTITSIAVSMILGVILNQILPDEKVAQETEE